MINFLNKRKAECRGFQMQLEDAAGEGQEEATKAQHPYRDR